MAFKTITRKLYDDKVELLFNPDSRNRYLVNIDGQSTNPVGVTTVLQVLNKPALMTWPMNMALDYIKTVSEYIEEAGYYYKVLPEDLDEASKAYVRKSDKGKDVGSEVHEAIERYLNDEDMGDFIKTATNQAVLAFNSFVLWWHDTHGKILGTEQIVYSRELNVAGTFDFLCEINGKTVLGDIKTSNVSRTAPRGCYPEALIQLGAYAEIYTEMHPEAKIDDLLVVNATKDGKLFTTYASDLGLSVSDCREAFKAVLNVYRFLTPLSKQLKELV